jgi:hypothetical protein
MFLTDRDFILCDVRNTVFIILTTASHQRAHIPAIAIVLSSAFVHCLLKIQYKGNAFRRQTEFLSYDRTSTRFGLLDKPVFHLGVWHPFLICLFTQILQVFYYMTLHRRKTIQTRRRSRF